jgi:hypothetical protein
LSARSAAETCAASAAGHSKIVSTCGASVMQSIGRYTDAWTCTIHAAARVLLQQAALAMMLTADALAEALPASLRAFGIDAAPAWIGLFAILLRILPACRNLHGPSSEQRCLRKHKPVDAKIQSTRQRDRSRRLCDLDVEWVAAKHSCDLTRRTEPRPSRTAGSAFSNGLLSCAIGQGPLRSPPTNSRLHGAASC